MEVDDFGGGEGCVESRRIGRREDRHTRESIRCATAILLPVRREAAEAWIPDGVDSAARTNRSLSRAALWRSIGTPEGGRESYGDPPRGSNGEGLRARDESEREGWWSERAIERLVGDLSGSRVRLGWVGFSSRL